MAYRLELSDLPPRYRAQAEAQLAGRGKKRGDTVTAAARAAAMSGLKFDSRGEYEYYVGTVAPKVGRGEIVKWEAHPCFLLFPAGEYNGVKLRSVQYTADFRLTYADGTVEIVEIKSKFCPADAAGLSCAAAGVFGADSPSGGLEIHGDHHGGGQGRNQTMAGAGGGGIIMWEKRLTHYDNDGRVYSSRGYEVALAKLAWFEDREQKREEMPVCGLCQRHQKLETVDGNGVLAGIRRGRQAPPCDGQHGAGRRAECAARGVLPHVRAVLRETGGGA